MARVKLMSQSVQYNGYRRGIMSHDVANGITLPIRSIFLEIG